MLLETHIEAIPTRTYSPWKVRLESDVLFQIRFRPTVLNNGPTWSDRFLLDNIYGVNRYPIKLSERGGILMMGLFSTFKASIGNVKGHRQCPTITATVKGPRIPVWTFLRCLCFSPQWGTLSAYSGDCTTERGIADPPESSVSLFPFLPNINIAEFHLI